MQIENQDLKLNIISLNDTIEDLRNKKKKLNEIVEQKETDIKSLEKAKMAVEAQAAGQMADDELSQLEENLRDILSSVIV
jgi:predicted nuclease with TOPRIM domain